MSDIIDFLNLLKNVKSNGQNGWTALCPAHDDTENSLAVAQGDDGRILVNCFAGCEAGDIVAAVGWKMSDLFVSDGRSGGSGSGSGSSPQGPGPARAITIADLAADKGIPLDFLSYYCEQLPFGVKIVYKNLDGKPAARQRLRIALSAKEGSRWTRGAGSPLIYGVWRVSRMSQESDTLLLVEGESDAWTAWLHKIAALGVPGADMAGKILKSYVDPFAKIYIWQEPDDGGKAFVKGVTERLVGLGYGGEVFIIQGSPIKDINELHKQILKQNAGSLEQAKTVFEEHWNAILSAAQPVDLSKITPRIKPLVPGVYFPGSVAPDPNYLSNPDSADLESVTFRNLTDMGNADRLISLHGNKILFCYPWNTWLVWNGKRWQRDETGEIDRKAEATVRSIYQEAANEPDRERRFEIVKHAKQSESASKIKAMIDRAKNRRPAVPDQFDRDTFLFNCQNGTIDLRTGELRPHNKNDLITKISPAKYILNEGEELGCGQFDLSKAAPLWDKFLRRVTNDDPELISFLQRAAGYALTGDTSEHCLFFLHGDGRNGKSVFLNTLEYVLGDYGSVARPDVLMAKKYGDGIPNEIAALVGVRFVSTTETGSGKRFAEAMLKQYTGGDTISARFLHAEFFTFKPQFKIFLASNHKPIIRGQDVAIWERIYLIPFTAYIPPEERDKRLGEKLRSEADGILRWAVEGCLMWQRDGLNPPDIVRAATEEYRQEMDVLGEFIEDRCYLNATARTTSAAMRKEYLDWCESNGEKYPIYQREFKAEMERRGIKYKRTSNTRYYLGIGLLSEGYEKQGIIESEDSGFNEKNRCFGKPENYNFNEESFNHGQNAPFDGDDPY